MSYRFLNNNAKGRYENDCTIRSIACATGNSWDAIYEKLSDIAQAQGTMMDDREFIIEYLDRRYKRIPYVEGTVGEISQKYKNNILLITMHGHITCSRYGIIYDSFDPRSRQVEFAWIVG